ncbi:MAG: branched-chain amino acid ABC transporter permease [Kiritimatiellae bacterium]|nr:branched-chain amino acid ABC transporter permease [Kiritimatiellia bacterium]
MRRFLKIVPVLAFAAAIVCFHLVVRDMQREYYLTQAIMTAYYAIVTLGLCLLMGYAGQVSFGQAAFFALGGYATAVLTTHPLAAPPLSSGATWLLHAGVLSARPAADGVQTMVTLAPGGAFAVSLALTGLVAWAVGVPALRLRGHYLAMATLGFGLILYRLLLGTPFTGGADGIAAVPPWEICDWLTIGGRKADRVANYYFAWSLALSVWLLLRNLVDGRPGRALRAIHDNETAAGVLGIDTARAKLQVFVLSAVLAAAAGSLMTFYNGGIGPSEAGATKSVRYVALVAAGGMMHLGGVLAVTTVLTYLSLRDCFGSLDHAVFGAILIAVVSLAPEGPRSWLARWRRLWQRVAPRPGGAP